MSAYDHMQYLRDRRAFETYLRVNSGSVEFEVNLLHKEIVYDNAFVSNDPRVVYVERHAIELGHFDIGSEQIERISEVCNIKTQCEQDLFFVDSMLTILKTM